MPIKITVDPKTGVERAEWVDEKPAAGKKADVPGAGIAGVVTQDAPTIFGSAASGISKGFQEYQRSGDLGKALGAYQGEYIKGLEQSSNPIPRVVTRAGRDLIQNVLGNAPADFGSALTGKPRPQKAGDARILGVLPALPDVKLQGPGEEAASEVVQGLLAWIPAARAVNVGVKALSLLPGAQVAGQAGATAAAFMKGSKAGRAALKAGQIATSGAATGAVVDLVAMDADRTRLTDQVAKWVDKQQGTPWYDPLVEMLRSQPGDTAADARWKNAVESTVFLGPAVGGLLYAGGKAAGAILRRAGNALRGPAEQVVDTTAKTVDEGAKAAAKPADIPNPTKDAASPNNPKTYAEMRPEPTGKDVRMPDPWGDLTASVQNLETQAAKLAYTTPTPIPTAPGQMADLVPPGVSQVAEVNPQSIAVDPQRLQFKEAGRLTKSGASGSLSGSTGFNPTLGGIISVWKDPTDGVTYVVNGHNRLRLAKESNYENVLVRYLDAQTPEQARAIGALQNISEGQGTPWDAAKFMRDTNTTVDGMVAQGIDLAGPVAEKAIPLTRLPASLFERGVQGKLDLAKAVALGSEPLDEAVILDVARKAGQGRWSAEKITQAMQEAKFASTQGPDGGVLPGFEDMFKTSNFTQLLDVRVSAFRALREEMVALTSAANARRTGYLEKAGNVIDVAGSREAKDAAAQAVAVFNKVTGYKGPVRDLLNELADQVTAKRPAKQLVEENLPRLRQAIEEEMNGPRLPLEEAAAPVARTAEPQPPAPRTEAPSPAAAAPEPSVPSAGSSAPAQASVEEIRELDALLASARADLKPDERIALRDEVLAKKYASGSPAEPPAPAAAVDNAVDNPAPAVVNDLPPEPPVPPVPAVSTFDDPSWVQRYAKAVDENLAGIKNGTVNYEDLTRSTYQQLESPSGNKVYVARQEPLAAGYDAMAQALPDRATTTGMPSFTAEELESLSKDWFARYGEDGEAVMQGILPLVRGFEDYQLGALHRAMVLADKQNVEAAIEGAKWINAQFSNLADQQERLAQLIQKAEAARRINDAIRKVTRRWGQIGAEQQLPRDGYDIGPVTGRGPQVDIEAQIRNELQQSEQVPVQEALTDKLSRELSAASLGGEMTPEAVAAADELAKSLVLMGEVPSMRSKFWDTYTKFTGSVGAPTGPLGWIQLLRTNNLISSGVTLAINFMNGLLNMPMLTLEQSLGFAVRGQGKEAAQALKMFEAFWLYKSSAMRTAGLTLKAGRPLVDMEASSIDWLARQAAQDAQGDLIKAAGKDSGWTITTMGVSPQWLDSIPGKIANTLWQTLGTGMSRLSITADAFNASLAGQGYEFVRNIDRGMELAVQQGLKEYSPEAWKFAHKYADERVQAMLKDVLLPNGQTFADVAVQGPEARNFMRAVVFTDDIVAQLEPRSLTEGIRLGQAQGLKDQQLIDFAEKYVKEGNWQHRTADFMLNGPVPIGRLGSVPGMAMEVLAATPVVGPIFRFIQPFIRVPNNIIKSVARRTPGANLLVDTWWRDIVSEDPGTRARAIGGLVTGGAFLAGTTMAMQAGKIRINGGGPQHPQGKLQWEMERRDPYSIQVWDDENERWGDSVSLLMFEPYTTLFGAIGDYMEIAASVPIETANRLGGALVMSVGKMATSNLLSKRYFQGFNEVYEALFGTNINVAQLGNMNQRDRLSRFASRLVASMVPLSSMQREARRGVDPVARSVNPSDVEGIMGFFYETLDEIKNATPGFSKDIPPRMNWVTNTPVMLSGIWGTEAIPADMDFLVGLAQFAPWSPVKKRAAMTDPISLEMAKLSARGAVFSGPAASDFGSQMRLDQSELNQYIGAFHLVKDANGRTWRDAVQELLTSDQYQSWPYDAPSVDRVSLRASSIQALTSQYKELAKREFYATSSKGAEISDYKERLEGDRREKENLRRYGGANAPQSTDPRSFIEQVNR